MQSSQRTDPPFRETHPRIPVPTVAVLALLASMAYSGRTFAQSYHTYPQIESALAAAETNYPAICRRVSLGTTVQGRTMWALCITDNPGVEEDEPEFCYISTMHGNEIIGMEMCLNLIDYLTVNYGVDSRVASLVNSVEIWIVPCMNPDGFVAGTRGNAHGTDLNRNFPDPYTSPLNTTAGREQEVANIMNWSFSRSFTLAANFHSGTIVVNYPFDANSSDVATNTPSPDDDLFRYVSEQYSQHNPPMWNSTTFPHGITNGADWYVVYGGMQDWLYVYMGGNEVTIELANSTPAASQIPTYWNNNRESMLAYMETCLIGVRGIVTGADTLAPLAASVSVVGRNHLTYTDPQIGDYHRMALPGTYGLRFDAAGYDPRIISGIVVPSGAAARVDVSLPRPARVVWPNGGEVLRTHRAVNVAWTGEPTAQFQVQVTLNNGDLRTTTDNFEAATLGAAYATGGNVVWSTTTGSAHGGTRAARSGAIAHSQTSWLTRTVTGGGPMSFWYRVSSESGYDYFDFSIDGQRQLHISGEVAWTQFTTTLAAGSHALKWEYTKDGSVIGGSDTAWIDDLSFVEDATTWSDVVALSPIGAVSSAWTPANVSTAAKVRVRANYGGTVWGNWDSSDAVFTVQAGPKPGDMNCDNLVNAADVTPFALALVDPAAYAAQYLNCNLLAADLNGDGAADGADAAPFVRLLLGY